MKEVYGPLIASGRTGRLPEIFGESQAIVGADPQLIEGKWPLIEALGSRANFWLWVDYRFFRYVPEDRQGAVFDSIEPVLVGGPDALLGTMNGTQRRDVLTRWAEHKGCDTYEACVQYVEANLPRWRKEYRSKMKYRLRLD